MKKIVLVSALILSSTSAFADQKTQNDKGGFTGPSAVKVKTVEMALEAKDDTPVILTGHIVSSLGDEEYQFKDSTGEIVVEIDHRDWNGIEATPETKLVIQGEVDKEWKHTAIDVNTIQLAK
ncbi:Protein YgiW [Vibrio chagasii]|uniref:YgiW/YdeI family stress tolerance OB fold protein n=1 Tax=Vibrio TaxID=662 RepID=UPI000769EA11|nr:MULTISPECIES: NirD/YgiW/YdeI family stress tolerance protein [Vibrio]MDE9382510.1 NirD/YgiW/YdeI family stress tolerance protein [Vibrio alginolyticus]MCG9561859.1 NirD/YgiW/YdeI family stress tolerance protein [Vibrio chagasii]MCG9567482.1 NirD/YgiW/YdeI family stress tolerance protein [Vibrio chagasii]MCG9603522.1 NirD/YgiW/YdeI family stress tolerance protein [Vibrio chagasii]MCG9674209.1 NirD/YgiW/YdeI family stress tolerance protein [Vibrio chagasii]